MSGTTSATIYEAEGAQLNGAVAAADHAGYSGGGFADYTGAAGASVAWTVSVPQAGRYELVWRYALDDEFAASGGGRPLQLSVNGQNANQAPRFAATGDEWTDWAVQTAAVSLPAGQSTIALTAGTASGANVDWLSVPAQPAGGDRPLLSGGVATAAGQPERSLEGASGIDPRSSFALDVTVVGGNGGVDAATLGAQTVQLYRTADGVAVPGRANTTGGLDAVVFTPDAPLEANTGYALSVDGVEDLAGVPFVAYGASFTTGAATGGGGGGGPTSPLQVAFSSSTAASGDLFTSLALSPDGSKLYAATLGGTVHRWDVDAATGALGNQQAFTSPALANRPMIGMAFDPADPNLLWVVSNGPGLENAQDFSGKISKVALGGGGGGAFTASVQDYVVGLPRAIRDHLSNSIAFHPDPETGQQLLYLVQGSNSAMGAPDDAWGNRPERLLNAAVLEIDPGRDVSGGPINVQTQDPNAALPPGAGAVGGYYDPSAAGAPVRIYATGLRNSYDLVWHSNGSLYVPNNGSSAGGNTPDDPNTPGNEALFGVSTQPDHLYRVVEGRYYGHPNPVRGEYVMNGGDPTGGPDPAEVSEYPDGTQPDPDYGGVAYDFSRNRSPNGAIEYTSDAFGGGLKGNLLVVEYSAGKDIVSLALDANGNVVGNDVLRDAAGSTLTFADPLDLVSDAASGRVYVASLGNGSISLLTPTPGGPAGGGALVLQAEAATLTPGPLSTATNTIQVKSTETGAVGGAYADFGDGVPSGESIAWTVTPAQGGEHDLAFRYSLDGVDRQLQLTVNGAAAGVLTFTDSGTFSSWGVLTARAALAGGQANAVVLSSIGTAGPNIDQLAVTPAPGGGDFV